MDLIAIVEEYSQLQKILINRLVQCFEIADKEFLLDLPRHGSIFLENEEWSFIRHGVGVRFISKESGRIVDPHVGIFQFPEAIDAWRIFQYLESSEIAEVSYKNNLIRINKLDVLDILLDEAATNGTLILIDPKRKLYDFNQKNPITGQP